MELIARWSWAAGLAGAVLAGGGLAGWRLTGSLTGSPSGLLGVGGVLLLLYGALDRHRLGAATSTRAFAYSVGSTLLVGLALGVSVAAYTVARRNDRTWDWTEAQQHALSGHTVGVVRALEHDVEVVAYFRGTSTGQSRFSDLIRRVQEHTDRLSVAFVDPLREPLRASEDGITGDHGTVLLHGNERTQRLDGEITEEELIRALVQLQSGEDHRICWTVGHGEPDPDDELSADGLGVVRGMLEQLNYQVVRLPTAQQGVPRDCAALVIARPTVDPFPYEREALAAYLSEGGRALVLLEPRDAPELSAALERYGVVVGEDVVVDLNRKNQLMGVDDPSMVVLSASDFAVHPVTRSLGAAVVLEIARSVRPRHDAAGLDVKTLIHTSPDAWGETDPGGAVVQPDEGLEVIGEVPVVVAVEIEDPGVLAVAPAEDAPPGTIEGRGSVGRAVPADLAPVPGGRLVVVGDSDFANNRLVSWGNNRDLFLNALAWLVEEEDQLGERPEAGDTLEISAFEEELLCLISVVGVPGLAVGLALLTLLRRRKL